MKKIKGRGVNPYYEQLIKQKTREECVDLKARKIVKIQSNRAQKIINIFNKKFSKRETKTHFAVYFEAFYPLNQGRERYWYIISPEICPEVNTSYKKTLDICKKLFPSVRVKLKSRYSNKIAFKIRNNQGYIVSK